MKEIIPIAEKLGYRGHLNYLPLVLPSSEKISFDPYKILEGFKCEIFFDHEFLKAWFGEKEVPTDLDDTVSYPAWIHHSHNLVLEEPVNRKAYLMRHKREG